MPRPRSEIGLTEYYLARCSTYTAGRIAESLGCSVAAVTRAGKALAKLRADRAVRKAPVVTPPAATRLDAVRTARAEAAWHASLCTLHGYTINPDLRVRVGEPGVAITTAPVFGGMSGGWHVVHRKPVVTLTLAPGLYQTLKSAGLRSQDAVHHAQDGVARVGSAMPLDARVVEADRFDDGGVVRTVALLDCTLAVLRGTRTVRVERGHIVVRTGAKGRATHLVPASRNGLARALTIYAAERETAFHSERLAAAEREAKEAAARAEEQAVEAALDDLVHDFA